MDKLTLGSLFDGSGGFTFGGLLCGIEPLWASEVEPFPIRVTTKRMPQVIHLGDINHINGAAIPPVDIITGGFPCQNLSLAGQRAGLHGERSGLFFQMVRVIKEMRKATNNKYPRFVVVENVPGMYSSNKGQDFREVLNELIQIKQEGLAPGQAISIPMPKNNKWLGAGEIVGDSYSLAYRTLCASGWGVPQRRRRCYLVVDFDGERAGQILFESEGMSGYSPQGGSPWQGSTADAEGCADAPSGRKPITFEPGALSRLGGHNWEDEACTLRADMGDNQLSVAIPINMQVATRHNALGEATGFGVGSVHLPTANAPSASDFFPIHADGDPAYTLQSAHSHAVAVENHPTDSRIKLDESGRIQTLTGRMGTGGGNVPLLLNERQYALTVGEDVANTLTGTDYKGTQCVFEPSAVPFRKGTRPHNKDEGQKWEEAEIANTLNTFDTGEARCNELAVMPIVPQTLKIRSGKDGGGKGALVQNDLSATLGCGNDQTLFVPALAYGISSYESNAMRSDNPTAGIYEADTSRTIDAGGGRPDAHQGGIAILALQGSMIGRDDKNGPQGSGINTDVCFTLNTIDKHCVAYDCRNHNTSEISGTLQAKENGGQSLNYINPVAHGETHYAVRRLLPQECALLQGLCKAGHYAKMPP